MAVGKTIKQINDSDALYRRAQNPNNTITRADGTVLQAAPNVMVSADGSGSHAQMTNGPFNISGASDATQSGLYQYGQHYTPSDLVKNAADYLQQVAGQKPAAYGGGNGGAGTGGGYLSELYNDVVGNKGKFRYDVNQDPLFQQYKNQYVVQGQKAMQDVMGAQAGLTGGYGSSWGSTAASQAYQSHLQQLNARVPELEERAFQRYKYENDLADQAAARAQAWDQINYGRYRDTVADWQADRSFAQSVYNNERNWDADEWGNLRNYYLTLAKMENGDYWNAQNFLEGQRQFDVNTAYNYYNTDLDNDYRWGTLSEQARQFNADDAYRWGTLAEQGRQFDSGMDYNYYTTDLDEAYRQAELAEKIRQYDLGYGLDRDEFNFKLRQYEDALAAAAAAAQSNPGPGTTPPKDQDTDPDKNPQTPGNTEQLVYPNIQNPTSLTMRDPVTGLPIANRPLPQTEWEKMKTAMDETYKNSIQYQNETALQRAMVDYAKKGSLRNNLITDESQLTEEQKAARARNKQLAAQRAEEKKKKQDEIDLKAILGR